MGTKVKIGIVVNNYKLSTYKRVLKAHDCEFDAVGFSDNTSSISVSVTPDRVAHLKSVCEDLEIYFRGKQN